MSGSVEPTNEADLVPVESDEFDDYDGSWGVDLGRYDLGRLGSETVLRGLAAVGVALFLIAAPANTPRALAVAIGVILLAWGWGGVQEARQESGWTTFTALKLIVLAVLGVGVMVFPPTSLETMGRLAGVAAIATGGIALFRAYQRRPAPIAERVVGALLYVAIGVALIISPESLLRLALLAVSIYWFVAGVLAVALNLRQDHPPTRPGDTWRDFLSWVSQRPHSAGDRKELYTNIFFEGREGSRRLSRYLILMGFATTIAAFGVMADSTAVVIGAMLIAPLMTPLMGMSLSMAMGWPRRVAMSALVALAGISLAIGLSIIFGWMIGFDISTTVNSQVASRIQPSLVDLAIAIAAGGAGAFALSRPDVSDSLPGVAVAIALVPPLAVVGLMIAQNDWTAAVGAMLLFVTNLVAILLIGALVFVLTGVVPLFQMSRNERQVKLGLGMGLILALVVVGVLGASSGQIRAQAEGRNIVTDAVNEWLEGTPNELVEVRITPSTAEVDIRGPEAPPPVDDLAAAIAEDWPREVTVTVNWTPRETFTSGEN